MFRENAEENQFPVLCIQETISNRELMCSKEENVGAFLNLDVSQGISERNRSQTVGEEAPILL